MVVLGVGSTEVRTPIDFVEAVEDLKKTGAPTAWLDVYDEAGVGMPTVAWLCRKTPPRGGSAAAALETPHRPRLRGLSLLGRLAEAAFVRFENLDEDLQFLVARQARGNLECPRHQRNAVAGRRRSGHCSRRTFLGG